MQMTGIESSAMDTQMAQMLQFHEACKSANWRWCLGKAAKAMVDVYTNTRSKFTVGDRDHYLFNPRDLTLWVMQLLRYDIVSVNTF